jgi:hypothetical protein
MPVWQDPGLDIIYMRIVNSMLKTSQAEFGSSTHTDLDKIGWPSQQSKYKEIAELSQDVTVSPTLRLGSPHTRTSIK